MNKFWIILSHTFMTRVKSKAFLISTIITLLFIAGVANIQTIMDAFSDDGSDQIAVIDESDELFDPLSQSVEQSDENMELVLFDGSEEEAKTAVQEEEYQALLVLALNENQLPESTYYADDISGAGVQTVIEQQLQQLKVALATQQAGIDAATLEQIYAPVTFEPIALDETAKTSEELNQTRGIVYIMLFVLYMAIIIYGQMIATDVATEKSSRVMEILVSSAPPVTHMFAKIAGIALLGLTQVGLFVGVGYALIMSKQEELTGGVFEYLGIQDGSVSVYIYALVFFILGYFLYATLAAMLGALVSRVEDANQMMMPMILLIMVAFFIAMFGLSTPESSLVKITSFIPFFAPMIMFLRVGMLDIPVWEVALSIGLLVATIVLLAIIGARIYKGGVLMYGGTNSLKDLKKAFTLSKKE
ncbi:ABC-2 type transport system permease protein [Virgibacillus natechei]|uniref:ABC-2 type transport system permease protein n=1 Tax=Virgibacillus natechei TaxID=1216297 RepID=A0ABS4IDJ1_9BACI|nr:ABC transporter permease [Virgibacillus natechei]MBP1968970.1 ABC-2 type transport system permease protein [Virgibacillus natechei]UZD14249.1 ABC transporter permease [Virgibacillus natechei]